MKFRNGFVSNSSSSSFIVAVEPNCQVSVTDQAVLEHKAEEGLDDAETAAFVAKLNQILDGLRKGKTFWDEEIGWETSSVIIDLPGVHILGDVDGSSDCGQLVGVTAAKMKAVASKL